MTKTILMLLGLLSVPSALLVGLFLVAKALYPPGCFATLTVGAGLVLYGVVGNALLPEPQRKPSEDPEQSPAGMLR